MRKIIVAALAATLLPTIVFAQTPSPRARPLTGNIGQDIKNAIAPQPDPSGIANEGPLAQALSKPFEEIANVIGGDIDGAFALSTAIPTLQDGNGQQCWAGFREFGSILKIHPLPLTGHAATDLQAARLFAMSANKLCANAHCSQVFTELQNAVGQIAPLKAGSGVVVPSLASICALIPQVAVAPIDSSLTPSAVTPTAATPTAPAAPAPAPAPAPANP